MKYKNGVEARVGDVCFFDNTAISITIEGERGIEALSHMVDSQEYGLLNLAHRPFQVGDVVEVDTTVGRKTLLSCQTADDAEFLNRKSNARHENPLWRDHPHYKKQSVKLLIKPCAGRKYERD